MEIKKERYHFAMISMTKGSLMYCSIEKIDQMN